MYMGQRLNNLLHGLTKFVHKKLAFWMTKNLINSKKLFIVEFKAYYKKRSNNLHSRVRN